MQRIAYFSRKWTEITVFAKLFYELGLSSVEGKCGNVRNLKKKKGTVVEIKM